jgi:predicted phosphodiesterase
MILLATALTLDLMRHLFYSEILSRGGSNMEHGDKKRICPRRDFLRRAAGAAGTLGLTAGGLAGCDPSSFWDYATLNEADKVTDRFWESVSGECKPLDFPAPTSDTYSFLWASDIHISTVHNHHMDRLGAYADQIGAVFVLHSGDCADDGTSDDYHKWLQVMETYLHVPLFSALGNHDVYNQGWDRFKKYIGPSVFRFPYGLCDFIFIDTANGTMGQDQMHWFEKALDKGSASPHRFVLSHYPIYDGGLQTPASMGNTEERMKLIALMDDYDVKYFLCGHKHSFEHYEIRGIDHIISGCGSSYKQLLNDDYHFFRFDVTGPVISKKKIYYDDVEW